MRPNTSYREVCEIEDDPKRSTDLIDGGGWDLLTVARRARRISDDRFTEIVVYVIGLREDVARTEG